MQSDDEMISHQKPTRVEECRMYRIRWFILGMFVAYSATNAMQWIQLAIISDVIIDYYNVSTTAVDWTSLIYMVLYIPFIFPGSYILDKLGLRKAVLIGSAGTVIGSWVKVAAVSSDRFLVLFLGQAIVALSQVFILSLPARIAAVWFGPSQVSSACSIGVFGNQLGIAIGFLIPPMIVKGTDVDSTTREFYILFIMVASVVSLIFLAILIFFRDEPPTPPSLARLKAQSDDEEVNFFQSLKRLFVNVQYLLLLAAYGINVGVFYAISTVLNRVILSYYEGASEDAGRIGLVMVLAGMVGSVICGFILDKYHKYKETTVAVYLFSLIGMVIFTFTISEGIGVVYFTGALLGFFMTGLLPVGFELGAELTFPEPEGTAAGLLNAASQVFGIAFTSIYSAMFDKVGDVWSNITMCIVMLVGAVFLLLIKSNYKRQNAHHTKVNEKIST